MRLRHQPGTAEPYALSIAAPTIAVVTMTCLRASKGRSGKKNDSMLSRQTNASSGSVVNLSCQQAVT